MASIDIGPHLTAAQLNAILAKTVANATLADLRKILDALNRIGGAFNSESATITSLLP